jgi:beta-lactam-binding protein with PASTA domain
MMNTLKAYLRSKPFAINLALIIALIFILIFGTLKWLSHYTNHGDFVEVPDFKSQEVLKLDGFIEGKDVSYKIIDSIYDPGQKPGVVLRQDPDAGSKVKHNRTVYLYVTGMVPPQILMPKLIDRSERQARLIIQSYGLKTGSVKQVKADCNGCVIEQLMKGRVIEAGKAIPKGSRIDLVVGTKDAFFGQTDSLNTKTNEEQTE